MKRKKMKTTSGMLHPVPVPIKLGIEWDPHLPVHPMVLEKASFSIGGCSRGSEKEVRLNHHHIFHG